jgi:hypothetical protein
MAGLMRSDRTLAFYGIQKHVEEAKSGHFWLFAGCQMAILGLLAKRVKNPKKCQKVSKSGIFNAAKNPHYLEKCHFCSGAKPSVNAGIFTNSTPLLKCHRGPYYHFFTRILLYS